MNEFRILSDLGHRKTYSPVDGQFKAIFILSFYMFKEDLYCLYCAILGFTGMLL